MKFYLAELSLLAAVTGGAAGQLVSAGPDGKAMAGGKGIGGGHPHWPGHTGAPQATGQPQQPPPQQQPPQQQPPQQQPPQQQPPQQQPPAQQSPQGQPQGQPQATNPVTTRAPGAPAKTTTAPAMPSSKGAGGQGGGQGAGGSLPAGGKGGADGGMTVDFINKLGRDLWVSYGHNAGGPDFGGSPTAGPMGTSTQVTMPTGWAGRVYVDTKAQVDPQGTKFEGSTTGPPDIDVSYVDGYNVPMSCSVNGETIVGCNIDLYAKGSCPSAKHGDVCVNPSNTAVGDKTAVPFFEPCVGAAYTFPNDNIANVSNLKGNYVVCCIGTACPAPARQGQNANKITKRSTLHGNANGGGDDPTERRRLRRQSPNQQHVARRALHAGSLMARHQQGLTL